MGGCWGSQGGRLGPCLFGFVGLLPILCFSGSGWRGGFVFYWFFFTWKGSYVGGVFSFCFGFFMVFGSSEVTFSVILVSLGRLWTRLVPGGVQGADLVKIVRSTEPFWLHVGVIFGVKR